MRSDKATKQLSNKATKQQAAAKQLSNSAAQAAQAAQAAPALQANLLAMLACTPYSSKALLFSRVLE